NGANNFSGPLVFQLFENPDLTPDTAAHIEQFTNDGYYAGKHFTRVATGFPGPTDYVVQGGAPTPDGTGDSGQSGTPFATESVQQLAYTGSMQLAMARSNNRNSNDTQFFITTGSPNSQLSYNFTIFGQMLTGDQTFTKMTLVPVTQNPKLDNEDSLPVNPLIMSSVSLSSQNPNRVLVVDTSHARPGETSTITVTAHSLAGGADVSEQFVVTVGPYQGPMDPAINFVPFAIPMTAQAAVDSPAAITLTAQSGYPGSNQPTLGYMLTALPSHGAISQF